MSEKKSQIWKIKKNPKTITEIFSGGHTVT
jgi:hypothetical protein